MFKNINRLLIRTFVLQTILIALTIYFVSDGFSWNHFLSFLAALIVIDFVYLFKFIPTRVFNTAILFIFIFQVINYIFMADYIAVETLFNLPSYNEIKTSVIIKAIIGINLTFLLWTPFIIFPKIELSRKNNAIAVLVAMTSLLLPIITELIAPVKEIYTIISSETFFDLDIAKQFEREKISIGESPINAKNNNVIVIFAEGTSRRVITPEITPNTYKLMGKSFCVDNYFCHTAPTYRGIRGQLMSGYQQNGIYIGDRIAMNPKLSSIPMLQTILDKEGYKTCFVSPDLWIDAFNSMILKLSFQKIVIDKTLSEIQSDKDTYEALFKAVDEYEKSKEKYLICTYIQGTHVYLDSPHEKYKDGQDACLNKFYNQDHWFGEFIKKMESNHYLDNTLLIFTADHSTYPTPDFDKAFKSTHNSFIDRVPFFIYKNGITPRHFDAQNKNSLSLTPTILNILGVENYRNYFLGNSLFSEEKSPYQSLSVRESVVVDTSSGKPKTVNYPKQELLDKIRTYYKLFG